MPTEKTLGFSTITVDIASSVGWLLYDLAPRNAWNWTMLEEQARHCAYFQTMRRCA